MPKNVDVVKYSKLQNKHRSEIFNGKRAVVVLIPKKKSRIGHFVALLPRRHHIEYFSSLGGSPDSELEALGEPLHIFQELLGKNYIYNRTRLQSGSYKVEDCAAWVLARVLLSKLKLREFVAMFQRTITLSDPDTIVAALTLLLFSDKSQ